MEHCLSAFVSSSPINSLRPSHRNSPVSVSKPVPFIPRRRSTPCRIAPRIVPKALHPLVLTEESVNQALDEVKVKLGSIFGNSQENRDVGITGDVALSSLDGPVVVLRLQGRFWHKRTDVVRSFHTPALRRVY